MGKANMDEPSSEERGRLRELVEENNRLRQEVYRLEGELDEYRAQLAAGRYAGPTGHALRWQVGDVMVQALHRPGWATLRAPDRLIRLLWRGWRQRRRQGG